MASSINKEELVENMSANLVLLRTCLGLSQSELGEKIGLSRQTLMAFEKGRRVMQWGTFMSLLSVFREDASASGLLVYFGIYTEELGRYLVSPGSVARRA
ncbi:MAG: helix-turn-helix domain-containing protein [Eubacteriaceae bacterium]|nr:helix-turn-helix domain-containing protein [Eubacteriaceae bacterium]